MSYVLNLSNANALGNLFTQIDGLMPQTCSGDPNGQLAASQAGLWAYDTHNNQLYNSSSGDGTIGGTTWVLQNFVTTSATTSAQGLVKLATSAEVATGTNTTDAVTPASLVANYAAINGSGVNSTIQQLTGLVGPLTYQQMFGVSTAHLALMQLLPSVSGKAGNVLGTDGTDAFWTNPSGTSVGFVQTTGTNMVVNGVYYFSTNNCSAILPASPLNGNQIWFSVLSGVIGCSITTSDGSLINGVAAPMNLNVSGVRGSLIYTGSVNGWMVI